MQQAVRRPRARGRDVRGAEPLQCLPGRRQAQAAYKTARSAASCAPTTPARRGRTRCETPALLARTTPSWAAYKDGRGGATSCAPTTRASRDIRGAKPLLRLPDDAKLEAAYKDGRGGAASCAPTTLRGGRTRQTPACPDDAKLQAHYKDEPGKCRKRADHAREAGRTRC